MQVAIPYITEKNAYINALFLQPTTWCAKNCKGCYVKGFENEIGSESYSYPLFQRIFTEIILGQRIQANQITMALDSLPSIGRYDRKEMLYIADCYCAIIDAAKIKRMQTEFHITVNSFDDLLEYGFKSKEYFDVLSVSTSGIDFTKEISYFRTHAKHINWNYTIYPEMPADKVIKNLKMRIPSYDSIYLILLKPDTGNRIDAQTLSNYLRIREKISKLPDEIKSKINIDGCIQDSENYLKNNKGCSSNLSRFQVWPNGAVSGCPYSHRPDTGPSNDIETLLKNIKESSRQYTFRRCKIPEQIDPTHYKNQVKSHPYLEIID